MTNVVITSFFEKEYLERIRSVDESLQVFYEQRLVPPPRWPGDHVGPADWDRTPEEDEEFRRTLLAEAEVLYDFPRKHIRDLTEVAPNLRWVQGSMAGAGEVAQKAGLQNTDVLVTTAGGVFSGPLAEFAVMAFLQHAKDLDRLRREKEEKVWNQTTVGTLEGKTLCIVGLGNIGGEVAKRVRPFGMRVVGVKRTVREDDEARDYADELCTNEDLHGALGDADYVVVTLPGTPETHRLIDEAALRSIKPGGVLSEHRARERGGRGGVGRGFGGWTAFGGGVGRVRDRAVCRKESPLWEIENVILSPHSTDMVPEVVNERQTRLFCENLRRYLADEEVDQRSGQAVVVLGLFQVCRNIRDGIFTY